MHRIFVNKEDIFRVFVVEDKRELHHALDVLRLTENDQIIAFDGRGNEILATIQTINKEKMVVVPQKTIRKNEQKPWNITLACALPKATKFDYIVEKTTELGVAAIIPLVTQRTEVHLNKQRQIAKLKRWQNIAISAAKQSQRVSVPEISEVKTFKAIINSFVDYELVLLPCLIGKRKSLKEILKDYQAKKILVMIGPEGDFTKSEIDLAINQGALPITLGETVLRVDTAAIAVVCAINALLS